MPDGLPGNYVSKTGEAPAQPGQRTEARVLEMDRVYEDRAALAVAMRVSGYTYQEISEHLGISRRALYRTLMKRRVSGELQDVLHHMDNLAVPQAVENLQKLLEDGDKEATFKTLQGRGVFRSFSHNKNELAPGTTLPALQIEFVSPDGKALPTVIVNTERGAIAGRPVEE